MVEGPAQTKWKALPLQLIESHDGVVLKRGCEELKVSGKGATDAVKRVLSACADGGASSKDIRDRFAPEAWPMVDRLIDQLRARNLLVRSDTIQQVEDEPESSLEVFYWHFDEQAAQVTDRLNKRRIVILGVNCISRQLASALCASGVENFEVVDHPLLRNIRMFDPVGNLKVDQWQRNLKLPQVWMGDIGSKPLDCLVATCDFGGQEMMREWNRLCIEIDVHFMPIVLHNLIGYIGPLVVPGETACFECLRARQNSHMKDYEGMRAAEEAAFESQSVIGFHPSMASILGDMAAFELTKFYSGALPCWNVGTLIEVNLLSNRMVPRKVLKIPRCLVCSPLNRQPSVTSERTNFVSYSEDGE